MTEITNPSGSQEQKPVADAMEKKDMVAYETYQKTLAEVKAAKATKAELAKQNEELVAKLNSIEEAKLQEAGEYKKIAELRADEAKKAMQERDSYKKDFEDTWKLQAFFDKLPGQIKNNEYLAFVDLESIVLDPETRQVESSSVEQVVSSFMEKHSDLVKMKKASGMPSDAPKPAAKKSIGEMNATEKAAFMRQAIEASMSEKR